MCEFHAEDDPSSQGLRKVRSFLPTPSTPVTILTPLLVCLTPQRPSRRHFQKLVECVCFKGPLQASQAFTALHYRGALTREKPVSPFLFQGSRLSIIRAAC